MKKADEALQEALIMFPTVSIWIFPLVQYKKKIECTDERLSCFSDYHFYYLLHH